MNGLNPINIISAFKNIVDDNRSRLAIICGEQVVNYQELDARSNLIANELLIQGAKPGDLVGISTERSVETIAGIIAILKVGCGYVPLPSYYPDQRLEKIIAVAGIDIVLGDGKFAAIKNLKTISLLPLCSEDEIGDINLPSIEPTDIAYVMFTSGSTGVPKGVKVPHRAVLRLVINQNYMTLGAEQRILQNSPIAFDASTLEIWGALLNGGTLVIPEEQELSLKGLGTVIKDQKVTVAWLTAGLFHAMVDERPDDLKPLTQLLTGGDVVSPNKVTKIKQHCPNLIVINGYGPTENTTFTCCHKISNEDLESELPLPIGTPIRGTDVFVLDEELQVVEDNKEGELYAAGDGLALGYLGDDAISKNVFISAPWDKSVLLYKTGDLVRKDKNGLFHYIGRADKQVKIRGFRIELGEIERAIESFSNIRQAVVVAKNAVDNTDKRLIAFYLSPNDVDTQKLIQYLSSSLPDYSIPSSFQHIDFLPLNANGKVDREALLNKLITQKNDKEPNKKSEPIGNVIGKNKLEQLIVNHLEDILALQSLDLKTNFFDLGASSLDIARLHERLEKELKKDIRITDFFLHSTISSLAEHLSDDKIKTLTRVNKSESTVDDNQIAIIGLSGRFPGANNVDDFWDALIHGKELISHFSSEDCDIALSTEVDPKDYVTARGILQNAEWFDAQHFGIPPRDAEKMDPQHRVLLEVAQEALDDAGYSSESYEGKIGVFAGNSQNSYLLNNIVSAPGAARAFASGYPVKDFSTLFGNDKDFNVTRIAYKLNLKGPAVNVQCACSTSLVAVAQACDSLRQGTSDIALAGGVSITFPQKRPYLYTPDGMASADGHCRTFDAEATGTVFGDGAGLVVLKRLQDALNDGDDIVAVIRGHSINNDGSDKIGYAAPSIKAQAEVIKAAHQAANVDPRTIGYVEAHGTGTPLGDPIEFAALQEAFSSQTSDTGFCALGTAKTNVGHLDIAAGITGLIKTALTLKKGTIPPLLHYKSSNPNIDFDSSAFYPVTKVTPWSANAEQKRRAGISAFGVGGTNIHMVLEEPPEKLMPVTAAENSNKNLQVFPFSASSETALTELTKNIGEWAESQPAINTIDLLYTLRHCRRNYDYRTVLVADDVKSLSAAAVDYSGKAQVYSAKNKIIMMLPGQGSQHVGMATQLYQNEVVFREALDLCATLLSPELGYNLVDIIQAPAERYDEMTALLKDTRIAQPAIFSIEYALAKQWAHWGIKPDILLGHSIGELAAACIAGVIELNDALNLIALRGQLMSDLPTGSMISVRASETEIAPFLNEGMDLAAVNGAKACVVAGPEEAAIALEKALSSNNIVSSRLHTSHAFHSRMMEPVLEKFKAAFEKVILNPPRIPIFSTVTGDWLTPEQAKDPSYWANHMRKPVRFFDGLQYLWKQEEKCIFLELGPGKTLSTLSAQNPDRASKKAKAQVSLASLPHAKDESSNDYIAILEAFGQLWASGYPVNWDYLDGFNIHTNSTPTKVKLPAYPFQRKRFWVEPVDVLPSIANDSAANISSANTKENTVEAKKSDLSVIDALRNMLSDLSGFDPDDMESDLSFLEMGFDSLLLTQAIKELANDFGIAVTLRQLIDGFDTLSDLAAHIESQGSYKNTVSATAKNTLELARQTKDSSNESGIEQKATGKTVVPIVSVENKSDTADDLSPQQRQHIDTLVKRYSEKTKKSKALTTQYRTYHADPRTASGFNRLWKEIVYQIVTVKSKGSRLIDVDGNEYIDILNGFGPGFLGHSPDHVTTALHEQIDAGFEVGPQSLIAMEAAQLFCEVTGNDRASFVCTGSEAVYAAMRLARTCTSRDKIVMFARDYHGNFDEVLVRGIDSKNGPRTMPMAPGIPRDAVSNVVVLPYGTPQSLDYIRQNASQLAAVMVEPVQSRRPEFQPVEFIREVREITRNAGALFIFDEVVTGFRFGPRGAQAFYGVDADLVTYGKVIGGGIPLGVVSGKAEYMDTFDGGQWQYGDNSFPEAPVTFFAGTFVRHPLAMASLKSMLTFFKQQPAHFWKAVNAKGDKLAGTVDRWFTENDMPFQMPNCGSLMYLRIAEDQKFGPLLGAHLRERGVFMLEGFPSYMTAAHDDDDIDYVIDAFKDSALEMRAGGMISGRDDTYSASQYKGPQVSVVPPRLALPDGEENISRAMAMPLEAPPILMTEAQKEIWLAIQIGGDDANLAYNESISLSLPDSIDKEVFSKALHKLAERHEALRMNVSEDGQSIYFKESIDIPIQIIDLSENQSNNSLSIVTIVDKEMRTPFDLGAGPLVRASICLLPDKATRIILTLHHIICDGWSFGILLTELPAIYTGLLNTQVVELPIPDSYEKYSLLEQQDTRNADLAYWLQQHSPPALDLDLPADFPRPAQRTYAAERIDSVIDKELTQQLRMLSRKTKTGFFALTYAAFCTYIAKLSQRDDFVIGVPYAGQLSSGMMHLVGHCVNVLPFRVNVSFEQTFSEFLQSLNTRLLEGFDHPNVTMGSLISAMSIPRDASRIPLIPITFNLDKNIGDLSFGEQLAAFTSNTRIAEPFELALNLEDKGEILEAQWSFNKQLFSVKTMQYRAEAFVELLRAIVKNADLSINTLPLVSSAEHICFRQWNQTEKDPSTLSAVPDWFNQSADKYPDKIAIEFQNEKVTYRQAASKVNAICQSLQKQGVKPKGLVGIYLERGVDLPLAMLAVMRMGCAYVPLDPHQPANRLSYILSDANVAALITNKTLPDEIEKSADLILNVNTLSNNSDLNEVGFNTQINLSDIAYVIYTSGSTGKPKGVAVKHLGLSNIIRSFQVAPGFTQEDRLFAITTAAFDIAGLELFLPLSIGASVIIAEENTAQDPEKLSELLDDYDVSVLQCVPTTWQLLLSYGGQLPQKLRGWCGGEALSAELASTIPASMEFWNVYGPTETTIWSTIQRVVPEELENNKPVLIGKPIDNTTLYILDKEKNQLPVGVSGSLWIGGAGVAAGYYKREALTEEKFQANPFANDKDSLIYDTGDLARLREDGSLEYMGRKDFQVKIRGFRIELGEIEAVLLSHSLIEACVVHAQKDNQGRDVLVGYFTVQENISDTQVLHQHLQGLLPDYMVPGIFIQLDSLPLNSNGKVDRAKLPSVENVKRAVVSSKNSSVLPKNDVDIIVFKLFQKYLSNHDINMEDDFFHNGGDSLAAVKLIVELNNTLGVNLPMAILLQVSTLQQLVAYIRNDHSQFSIKPIIELRYEKKGLPIFCLMGIQIYSALANFLGEGYSVYALLGKQENDFLQGVFSEQESKKSIIDINSLADEYVELILETKIDGPYYLLGFSSGGVVSIEVARRLRAMGKEVALVGLLDTMLPRGIINTYSSKIKQSIKGILSLLSKLKGQANKPASKMGKKSEQRLYNSHLIERRGDLLWKSIVNWDAKNNTYDGDAVVFQATDLSEMGSLRLEKGLGWKSVLTANHTIVDVPGNHSNLLKEPNVSAVAKALSEVICQHREK
ncbi:MAG: amino acid adenylation domain-containing protein [Cellvibrionaceae bacterium]